MRSLLGMAMPDNTTSIPKPKQAEAKQPSRRSFTTVHRHDDSGIAGRVSLSRNQPHAGDTGHAPIAYLCTCVHVASELDQPIEQPGRRGSQWPMSRPDGIDSRLLGPAVHVELLEPAWLVSLDQRPRQNGPAKAERGHFHQQYMVRRRPASGADKAHVVVVAVIADNGTQAQPTPLSQCLGID